MQRRKPSKRCAATSPEFIAVDQMTRQGEAFGWPSREAFSIAMQLFIAGVRPEQSAQLFARAERVRQ